MNDCFFCGPTKTPLTEEHVWPKWVSRLLVGKYRPGHFINVRSTGSNTTGLWRSRNIEFTTRTVCRTCNNEWLSSFENRQVKPIATPLIAGNSKVLLRPDDQWKLSAWAYKMAMLAEVAIPPNERPELYFTPAERKQFRETTIAHERIRVFLSNYKFGQHPAHAHLPVHTFTEREGKRRSFDLKISTMTVGALGIQVVAVRSASSRELTYASEIEFELLGKAKGAIVEVWPPSSAAVRWPPRETMTQQDIEDWTTMWAKPRTTT
ncbi:MAG TPA: hypothetical protein VFY29_13285 [Terriglobia bacterium]|nr:hypothetical protein [Terriglobia bacterium]